MLQEFDLGKGKRLAYPDIQTSLWSRGSVSSRESPNFIRISLARTTAVQAGAARTFSRTERNITAVSTHPLGGQTQEDPRLVFLAIVSPHIDVWGPCLACMYSQIRDMAQLLAGFIAATTS